jgi:hypothetical protein
MAHDGKAKTNFPLTISNTEESGVKAHGFYADPLGHQIFLVVESDTREQLVKFLDPVIDLGDYEVSPFLNFSTAIASLSNS